MTFDWDPGKAKQNIRKHGVSFEEASEVFSDPYALYEPDAEYEERGILIGASSQQRILFVVHVDLLEEDDVIRIISARVASNAQRRRYEEGDST